MNHLNNIVVSCATRIKQKIFRNHVGIRKKQLFLLNYLLMNLNKGVGAPAVVLRVEYNYNQHLQLRNYKMTVQLGILNTKWWPGTWMMKSWNMVVWRKLLLRWMIKIIIIIIRREIRRILEVIKLPLSKQNMPMNHRLLGKVEELE